MKHAGEAEVRVYLQYEGGLPREVTRLSYEQWRTGWPIPRKSVLELGAVPEALLGATAGQWVGLRGWRLWWKGKRLLRRLRAWR